MALHPSPAIAVVGRHNSGKTTLVEQLIAELVSRGLDIGSIKHHSHTGFDIDYPGKDSYRHRAAGASEVAISSPDQFALITSLSGERECPDIVAQMPGHDLIIVEGYRKSGLPTIEIMREANDRDLAAAETFAANAKAGLPLGADETADGKLPVGQTVAIVTDIDVAREAAAIYGIPAFDLNDITGIADFMERTATRPHVTVVIQAGGESRRMGQSKALVPFAGRPLICRLIERLSPAADELVITTNEGDRLAFLADAYPELGIRLVPDEYTFRGALPGLCTALKAASNPFVAVVACDMVYASSNLVIAEAGIMKAEGADAVIPVNKHGYEPFHAMYRKETCLPIIVSALERGESKAQSFFNEVTVREVTQAEVLQAEPMGGCFINANTPDELRALEENYLS